ncbi:E3 ubiquitin-protein like [Actinidia chinensis var. chinensis]|uniref:E3 ubiquitin-protein like n=1 Tax=Actinidia chinensis var. chinensis TaxID=1590841 RepID=A0A2R6S0L8_ACTCC|nr:E3 ubiquitin-protein like [Actinidia chinensis var. chinensis]
MAEEEVLIEVDAVQAVYGDDCIVLDTYPPHLHIHIKPRTADISSQQFVETVLGIQAGPQYPREPPHIHIVESKGLDEQRQSRLLTGIQLKAYELSSCLMLVALCEEAVEMLSSMNHPDGNCPLCLNPLVEEDAGDNILPFMKLMSCYHCFHCECIIRWWNWLQSQKEFHATNSSSGLGRAYGNTTNLQAAEESTGRCPVCREVFHAKDIDHVLDLVGAHSQLSSSDATVEEDENLLQSESEKSRRQKFEAILKLQQESSGLIEPKRNEVLLPGMFLPRSIPEPMTVPTEQEHTDRSIPLVTNSTSSSNRPSTSERRSLGTRNRGRNSRKQVQQWIKKENGNAH